MQPTTPPQADRATLDAMAAYLRTHLLKTVALAPGDVITALSETALRFNDSSWFWTDDNAKAAELLCEPVLYDQDPAAANAAIDFVLRMSQGDIIRRRAGPVELRAVCVDPAAFRIETAFMIIEGDLTRGVVRHALRFNDNRTVTAAQHGPGPLVLRHGWLPLRLDPAGSITAHAITTTPTRATLSHTSTIHGPGVLRGRALGTVRYTYTVVADRPFITIDVELAPAAGVVLDQVVLGLGLNGLDQVSDVHYRTVGVRRLGGDRFIRGMHGRDSILHEGGADYTAVVQGGSSPGFSYAIHALLLDGARLARVSGRERKRGRLQRVRHAYRLGRVGGSGASVTERRMVTGGGYYDRLGPYADLMGEGEGADQDRGTADPSMTYDIGAELNAIAVHVLFARRSRYATAPEPARLETLTCWYDRHVERYFDFIRPGSPDELERVFTRGIAFVVLSLDCMLRATGGARYRTLLATGVRLILATQRRRPGGLDTYTTFGDPWSGHYPFLDNHAACLLALARAAWHGDPGGAIAGTVHEAIRGIRLHSGTIDVGGGDLVAYDGLAVVNPPERRPHVDSGFWNYKLGVTLRALHATLAAVDAGMLSATPDQRLHAQARIDLARQQLVPSFRSHGSQLEVLTSRRAGETNSETQPWVALGMAPLLDQQIVGELPPG